MGTFSCPSSVVLSARGTGILFLVSLCSLYMIGLGRNKSEREAIVVFNSAPCQKPWKGSGIWSRSTLRWRPSSHPPARTFHSISDQARLCSSFGIPVRTAYKQFLAFSVQPDSHRGPNYQGKTQLAAAMCSTLPMLPTWFIAAKRPCVLSSISTLNNRINYLCILAICKA